VEQIATMIVTIDGPAGAGKSSVARLLAERLGFRFLDTGAMYRAVTWAALERQIDLADVPTLAKFAQTLDLTIRGDRVLVDGRDVTGEIRTSAITKQIFHAAGNAGVRSRLVDLQRQVAAGQNVVTEGRWRFPTPNARSSLQPRPRNGPVDDNWT
jgi:cytidylate kinase